MAIGQKWSSIAAATALDGTEYFLYQKGATNKRILSADMGVAGAISKTYAQLSTLKSNNTLVAGALYYISDSRIYIRALQNNELSKYCLYVGYNADYQKVGNYSGVAGFNAALGIWHSGLTPAAGDVVVWNNLHYKNLTGAVGTDPKTDAVNWVVLSTTLTTGFISEIDPVIYDFAGDTIVRREDKRGNVLTGIYTGFPWGNDKFVYNEIFDAASLGTISNYRGDFRFNVGMAQASFGDIIGTGSATSEFSYNVFHPGSSVDDIDITGASVVITGNVFEYGAIFSDCNFAANFQFIENRIRANGMVTNKSFDSGGLYFRKNDVGWQWTNVETISRTIDGEFQNMHYFKSKSLTTAQIKTLNSVPVNSGIPEAPAGYCWDFVNGSFELDYATAAFTSMIVYFKIDTATDNIGASDTVLTSVSNKWVKINPIISASTQLVAGKGLLITADADSGVGGGSAYAYATMQLIKNK